MPKIETIILSGDLDTLQLIDSQTKVYSLRKGVKETILYDENLVKERYEGLNPKQLVDFKALTGDMSDNIPGVPGIGEKTAIKLIKKFGNLENLYFALEKKEEAVEKLNPKVKDNLLRTKEQAFLSKMLAQVKRDVPIDFNLAKSSFKKYEKDKVIQIFKKFDFHSLIKRLSKTGEKESFMEKKKIKPVRKNLKLW